MFYCDFIANFRKQEQLENIKKLDSVKNFAWGKVRLERFGLNLIFQC
jgi:hypothetical protein